MKQWIVSRYPDMPKNWITIFVTIMAVSMGRNIAFDLHHYGWWSFNVWFSLAAAIAMGRKDVSLGIFALYYPMFHLPFVDFGGGSAIAYTCGALWSIWFFVAMINEPVDVSIKRCKELFDRWRA